MIWVLSYPSVLYFQLLVPPLPHSVTNMNKMFRGATNFNQNLNSWDGKSYGATCVHLSSSIHTKTYTCFISQYQKLRTCPSCFKMHSRSMVTSHHGSRVMQQTLGWLLIMQILSIKMSQRGRSLLLLIWNWCSIMQQVLIKTCASGQMISRTIL